MLAVESPRERSNANQVLFHGLLSNKSRLTLLQNGFTSFAPLPDEDMDVYLRQFSSLWGNLVGGPNPDPVEIRRQMDEQESMLQEIWHLALRNDVPEELLPLVAQAAVTDTANPLILRSPRLKVPLIVMSDGLWKLVLGGVLGTLHWAERGGSWEERGKNLFVGSAISWSENDPTLGPARVEVAEAAALDLDVANFAVGLANATFTWAFLHEMGHFVLGHLPSGEVFRRMSADSSETAGSLSYFRQDEIRADSFGFERFLGLMPLTMEIRRRMPFGPQIDHAPIVAFELMDLAYRVSGRVDLLDSKTHPNPLIRARLLHDSNTNYLSSEGKEWYLYWRERIDALRKELKC